MEQRAGFRAKVAINPSITAAYRGFNSQLVKGRMRACMHESVLTKVGNRARKLRAQIIYPNAQWEKFYAVKNLWKFDRPCEIYRFEETNRIIRDRSAQFHLCLRSAQRKAIRRNGSSMSPTGFMAWISARREPAPGKFRAKSLSDDFPLARFPAAIWISNRPIWWLSPKSSIMSSRRRCPPPSRLAERLGKKRI